jgi:hypothetical protein
MNNTSITINTNLKTIVAIISIPLFFLAIKNINESFAQTTSNLTGSCGMIQNYNHFGWNTAITGSSGNGSNGLAYLNFDTKMISGITNNISNFNLANTFESQEIFPPSPFTVKAGPISNTYTISIKTSNGIFNSIIMPVNGGQTYLVISSDSSVPNTGVCQKF